MNNVTDNIPPRHYVFLCFLTILNVMNFVDRQLLASFANFIVPDLELSNTEFGLLTGLVFISFYAVMGLFMGALADMVHRPRLVAFGLALWSALTAASGAAKGFVSLAIPRMFIGVGESVLTPTAMSMMADRFPQSKLGFASGFYYMGVPIGVGVSLLIAGYLGPAIGWRNCFYALGVIGLGLAVVLLFIKETPRKHLENRDNGPHHKPGFRKIARQFYEIMKFSPALSLTMAGGVATHFILGAAAFDQLWYVQERGFERAHIAQMTGWIGVAGGILGNLFGGLGSDWWQHHMKSGRPMFLVLILLILVPVGIAYRVVSPDSWFFWFAIFCGYFQLGSFYGPTFSTVQELVPPQIRSTVVAFYLLTLNLIGLGLGITLSGYTIDYMIEANISEPFTKTLLVFTFLSATAIPLFWFAARRFHQDRDRLYSAMAEGKFSFQQD
ncbi:MAG: MFS transporter [Gammaproteobacteria bacterium]|nr:MFS transporter [Gammaproteobacteria bacterium]